MTEDKKKFQIYQTVLRFLGYKITPNLKRIYLDVNLIFNQIILVAYYENAPSEIELELLDDIATNSKAHLPYQHVDYRYEVRKDYKEWEKHDFTVFATYQQE